MSNAKAAFPLILTVLFQITLVTARIHLTTHQEITSDQSNSLLIPSVTHQINSTIKIIDNGIHDQDADFASDIIALIFSTLSVFSTFTILILFYLEQSWVFGNEMKFLNRKENYSVLQVGNRVQQKRQVINKKKRQFIRRCMLALLIADLITSVSRIFFILWWWVCSRVAPDVMFSRTLVPVLKSNVTTSIGMNLAQNHIGIQMDSFNPIQIQFIPEPFTLPRNSFASVDNSSVSNITIMVARYDLKAGPTIINRLFAHVNFAASLSTATWCVVVAFAIYATTTNVKWMERQLGEISLPNSDDNSNNNSKHSSSFALDQDCSTENSEIIENSMSDQLVSIDLRQSNQSVLQTSQLHQQNFHDIASFRKMNESLDLDSSAPKRNSVFIENMNKLKKMTPFMKYEISFHIVAWGVGLFVFLVLFIFRFITTLVDTSKDVKTGYVTTIYISWNIYFTLTVLVNFVLLIIIWRYVGKYLNSTQLQVIPKKETKRRQISVILRLSLLILPYVICGVLEVAYWYYNICAMLLNTEDDTFILVFYNFFFNGLVPLRGFFFGIAFLLGSSEIRSFFKYIICCCGYCGNKKRVETNNQLLSQSLLQEDPNSSRNFQALIVEASSENLQSHDHYPLRAMSVIHQSDSSLVEHQQDSPNDSSSSPTQQLQQHHVHANSSTSKLRSGTMRPTPHNSSLNTILLQQDDSINLEQVTFGRLDSGSNSQYYQQANKKRARTFMPSSTTNNHSNTSSVGSPNSSNTGQSPPVTAGSNNASPRFNSIMVNNKQSSSPSTSNELNPTNL